jgi:hypothetical protein
VETGSKWGLVRTVGFPRGFPPQGNTHILGFFSSPFIIILRDAFVFIIEPVGNFYLIFVNFRMASEQYSYKYFTVHFPEIWKYVVHVEINRVDKLNAFIEP